MLSCQCYRAIAHTLFECKVLSFQATSPKSQSKNELWWTPVLAKTWLQGFHTAKCLIDIKKVLKRGEVNKERKGKYEESNWSSWWLFLLEESSPLFWVCSVPAGVCWLLKWRDTRWHKKVHLAYSPPLTAARIWVFYNWLSGSVLVLHLCPKPCIPPDSSSLCAAAWHLLFHQPCSLGWLGQGFSWWPMHNLWHPAGSVEQELGKQQLQLWLCLLPQVCRSCSALACFCLCWRALRAEAAPHHGDPVVWEWRPGLGQYLWVPLCMLMMPKACSDGWETFIKCSGVCMQNKLDCCPCCVLCLSGCVHRWCNPWKCWQWSASF